MILVDSMNKDRNTAIGDEDAERKPGSKMNGRKNQTDNPKSEERWTDKVKATYRLKRKAKLASRVILAPGLQTEDDVTLTTQAGQTIISES